MELEYLNMYLKETRLLQFNTWTLCLGIYLYKSTLAVLSIQHQTIHVFQLDKEGCLIKVREIGRHCYDDDEMILAGEECPYCCTNSHILQCISKVGNHMNPKNRQPM